MMKLAMQKQESLIGFFPETTIMLAGIVGLADWSSKREPTHVFAVSGLPKPDKEHAIST
jgi:hypothetical protein